MKLVHEFTCINTEAVAQLFSIALAEKGYTSTIEERAYGHVVIDETGKGVKFVKGNENGNPNGRPL